MKTEKIHPVVRKVICTCYNCPRNLACLLFGSNHKPHHRIITGVLIIVMGTLMGDIHCATAFTHVLNDGASRFIDAMGSVPIIEHIGKLANGFEVNKTAANTTEPVPNDQAVEHI